MGGWIRVFVLATMAAALATAAGDTNKFAGTWQAKLGDKVYLVLKVQSGEKITGTLNAGSIHMDDDGELIDVGPVENHEAPIFFAKPEGDKLEFDFQDEDNELIHFVLKVTSQDKAELLIVDEHLKKVKPFELRKQG